MSTPGPSDERRTSKLNDSNNSQTITENEVIPLDILKAEARERLAAEVDVEPDAELELDEDENNCIICLQPVVDRTVLINCAHDRMCFACIKKWSEQSRRCPLCNTPIGSHLIHRIRSQFDYQKYYLSPLRTSPPPSNIVAQARAAHRARSRRASAIAQEREQDELDRAIEKRRWVYRHGLFAKHIASNAHTRFRPNPTPQQISNSPELQSRCQMFVRRELRVWPNLDVEFLASFILSLAKSIDIRTEGAVKLIGEFLDIGGRRSPSGGTIAEHFVHELYSYLRSPFRDLPTYDAVVQYDAPENTEVAPRLSQNTRQGNEPGPSRDDSYTRRSPNNETRSWDKGKARECDKSDPLEASPRDWRADEDSDMDMDQPWIELPPSRNAKGKRRMSEDDRSDRRHGESQRNYWQRRHIKSERNYESERGRTSSSKYEDGESEYSQHRTSRSDRNRNDRTYRYNDRSPKRGELTRSIERIPEGVSRSKDNTSNRRSGEESRSEDRPLQYQKRPAGWNNHFEYDERSPVPRRDRSASPPSPSKNSRTHHGRAFRARSPSRGRRSPSRSRSAPRQGSSPSSPQLPHALHMQIDASSEESKFSESERLAPTLFESTANPHPPTPSSQHIPASTNGSGANNTSSLDNPNQPSITTKLGNRNRPTRLMTLASIRLHLQGTSRPSDIPSPTPKLENEHATEPGNIGPINQNVTRSTTQPNANDSLRILERPVSLDAAEVPPSLHPQTPDSSSAEVAPNLPHDNATVSDNFSIQTPTPTVSYSILGAAARSKDQLLLITASDSIQRVPPSSMHGPTLGRNRLPERLEAKAMGTLSNTDINASHLSKKTSTVPTQPDVPEIFVPDPSDTVTQELRLRLAARSHLARKSPTSISGSSQNSHSSADPADANSPAARFEAERRLKLHARLVARKRDINAVMGATPSSTDTIPR